METKMNDNGIGADAYWDAMMTAFRAYLAAQKSGDEQAISDTRKACQDADARWNRFCAADDARMRLLRTERLAQSGS